MTSDVVPSTEGDRRRSKHPVQWSDGDQQQQRSTNNSHYTVNNLHYNGPPMATAQAT